MLRILHLSDLHFGKLLPTQQIAGKSTSAHRFIAGDEPFPGALADILLRDVDPNPDIIIVSGDVGWSGAKEDYEYARKFFEALRNKWPNVPLIVAPGNHDVDCSLSSGQQEEFVSFLQDLHGSNFSNQYPFLKSAAPIDRQTLTAVHQVTSSTGSGNTLIVAVNSAADICKPKDDPVFISPSTLQAIEDKIRSLNLPESTFRIFVLHHHLFPFAEKSWGNVVDPRIAKQELDTSLIWNSAKLQGWLAENSFHLVLHGHKHLSHGREDILWRRDGSATQDGRRIFVVGAGSAGVEQNRREHGEPLSYNLVSATRLSEARWNVHVSVRQVVENTAITRGLPLYSYGADVGTAPVGAPRIFQAERMDDCHRAIQNACNGKGLITSFMSVVENSAYIHPKTTQIDDKPADATKVYSSFLALHPEYDEKEGWTDMSKVADHLQAVSPRFRFQHGPRLFGHPERRTGTRRDQKTDDTRPILRAVENIKLGDSSAYVSLFNPEIDVLSRDEPLPGLMSIQFIRESRYLDVVATFRKLELSFWWVVNMYELGELLRWAEHKVRDQNLTARRITFFAALAEWKKDPKPAFVTRLDAMQLRELSSLVQGAYDVTRGATKRDQLKSHIVEKKEHTSDTNLDPSGLDSLAQLMAGLKPDTSRRTPKALSDELITRVAEAAAHIRSAMKRSKEERGVDVDRAKKALDGAIKAL